MANASSSTTVVVPSYTPMVMTGTDSSRNLVILKVNAQAPLKLTAMNYSVWWLQFTSLLFCYDLLGFVDGSQSCPPTMITLLDVASPSPNLDYTLWLLQDQLLLNAIIGSVSPTLVQFLSTSASTTSRAAWATLKKTYASPSSGHIMVHIQNFSSPQQGTRTITKYMLDVKHNIDSLALMNFPVDFDEVYVRVLNGLG